MDFVLKFFASHFVKPFLNFYLRKQRYYTYKEIKLAISPGVFHPGFFFSTKVLADFISSLELKGKKFCEPGTGAGLVSLSALREGAAVLAFDINPQAVEDCRHNFELNKHLFEKGSFFEVRQSDLFDNISSQTFDIIAVNPPYFFDNAMDDSGKAWYAGKEGEYFERFFNQLNNYLHERSQVYMILGDNCEIKRIEAIATKHNFILSQQYVKKTLWERNFIFKIERR